MTTLAPIAGRLTLDDLEALAHRYGGTIEPRAFGYALVNTVINGRRMTLSAVTA